jgi:hypothetical protein
MGTKSGKVLPAMQISRCHIERTGFDEAESHILSIVLVRKYLGYLRLGRFGAGLQGRYLFPIFVPFLFLAIQPLAVVLSNGRILLLLACLVTLPFGMNGIFFFRRQVTMQWIR